MTAPLKDQVTAILVQAEGGDGPPALDHLIPLVYDELRNMAARRLRSDGEDLTLSPTELVHEAYMRLADATRVTTRGRAYFFASAARAMRQIVVDHARRRGRHKRGGGKRPITLNDAIALTGEGEVDVLDLERGLDRLATLAERSVHVVECRFFGGLSVEDTALTLGVTPRTVNRDWQFAKAWLFDYLSGPSGAERLS
jgi:RNA polymerase sigma-70 factor (ECF subfamily)